MENKVKDEDQLTLNLIREQTSSEYAISLTSWLLGPNVVLKQLEAVDEDRKEESVADEFEDCRVDLEENADEDESEGGRSELMNRPGLVAFVKDNDDDNDKQGETDEDDPNYTPPVEKSDTEDDSSEEDDEGNESDIDDDDQEQNVAEMRPHKKGIEATSEDESEDDEEKNKVKRSIFGKKRGLPLGQASESESKKRKSSFDTDDNMEEEEEEDRDVDELTETQKSVLEAAEEGLYDNLDEEDPEDGFKTGRRQDPRISKGNMAEDDSSYQSDADEEGGEVCTI